MLFFGFPAAAEEVSAGPSEALSLPEGSSASYIEPNGNSFNAQRERIDKLEYQINELGLAAILGQKNERGKQLRVKELIDHKAILQ